MEETAKKRRDLLVSYREETKKQLGFLQEKEPERFLASVLVCEGLIKQVEDCSSFPTLEEDSQEMKEIITEIIQIREQISKLIPDVQKELLDRVKVGQQQAKIMKGYREKSLQPPSVFFDKRK